MWFGCGVVPAGEGQRRYRPTIFIWASLWWSPATSARASSWAICSGVRVRASAAVFSSRRWTRLVPGMGTMSSPRVSSQARATWAGVAPASAEMALTWSASWRLWSKLAPVKRGLEARRSPVSKRVSVVMAPVSQRGRAVSKRPCRCQAHAGREGSRVRGRGSTASTRFGTR